MLTWVRKRSAAARSRISGFGLCATEAFEPRQIRKEATVEGPSVCHRITRSLTNLERRCFRRLREITAGKARQLPTKNHLVSSHCTVVAAAEIFRSHRAEARHGDAAKRHPAGTDRTRLYFLGTAWNRQNHAGAPARKSSELQSRPGARAVRRMRLLPRDRRRALGRCHRDRRGVQPRHRRRP